jgi:hypothetical protein
MVMRELVFAILRQAVAESKFLQQDVGVGGVGGDQNG